MNHKVHIFKLLGNQSILTVLKYFLENPSGKYYLAQLTRTLKLSKVSVIKALAALRSGGLLKAEKLGNSVFHYIDGNNTMVKELKKLNTISYLFQELKFPVLLDFEVYLYGSAARGENDEKSDFDVLIITNKKTEVTDLLGTINNEKIKILVLSPVQYASLFKTDKPFYERLEKDKLRLSS